MFIAQLAAVLVALVFVALALLHVGWASGSAFPSRDRDRLLAVVIGRPIGKPMPGRVATWIVAIGLLVAAWWTWALAGLVAAPVSAGWLRAGGLAMVAVFGLRCIGGYFESRLRPEIRGTPYSDYSRRLYSPLAGLIAVLVACAMLG